MKRIFNASGLLCLSLFFVIFASIKMQPSKGWSNEMNRRADLGFSHGLNSPLLAVELAWSKDDFTAIFDGLAPTVLAKDVNKIQIILHWDFLFLTGYAGIIAAVILHMKRLRTIQTKLELWLSLGFVGLLALLDVAENLICLKQLATDPIHFEYWEARASLAKWSVSFLICLAISCAMLRTQKLDNLDNRKLSASWCLAALLMLGGAVTGLLGVIGHLISQVGLPFPNSLQLISPGFGTLGLAIPVLCFAWIFGTRPSNVIALADSLKPDAET